MLINFDITTAFLRCTKQPLTSEFEEIYHYVSLQILATRLNKTEEKITAAAK